MAIKESREIVIEASAGEILDVIADFEAMPEWSGPHQSAEVLETGDDGRPSQVKMKVKIAGITDEQVVAYTLERQRGELDAGQLRASRSRRTASTPWFPRATTPWSSSRYRRPECSAARLRAQARRQGDDGYRDRGTAQAGAAGEG